jgi:hypothetical protein
MIIATQEHKYLDPSLKLLKVTEIDLDSLIEEFERELPNDLNACL